MEARFVSRMGFLASLLALLLCGQASAQPSAGLLGYWPFNGNALDESHHGHDGVVFGATLVGDRFNDPYRAYDFDGTDDHIVVAAGTALQPPLPVTICAWFKRNPSAMHSNLFTNCFELDRYWGVWMVVSPTGYVSISYGDGGDLGPGSRRTKSSTIALADGAWYHLAGVIRSATDMDIYVNGEAVDGSYSGTGGSLAYTQAPGEIGTSDSPGQPQNFAHGTIDDIAFYDRVLSPYEIQSIYYSGVSGFYIVFSGDHEGMYPTTETSRTQVATESACEQLPIPVPGPCTCSGDPYHCYNGCPVCIIVIPDPICKTVWQDGGWTVTGNCGGGISGYWDVVYRGPDGACCEPDGSCTVMNEVQCGSPGTWLGAGTTCAPNLCPLPTGACCAPDGSCAMTLEGQCGELNTWQGMLTTCTPNPCPQPPGACCINDGTCVVTTQAECPEPTYWQGAGVPCTPDVCSWVGIADGASLATSLSLRAAPNPCAGPIDLAFSGPRGAEATLLIVGASGRRVRTAWQGVLNGRAITVHWDGHDDSAREAPAGIYLVRLQSGSSSVVVRLVKAR